MLDEKMLTPAVPGEVIAVLPLTDQMMAGLMECLELSLIAAADRRRGLAVAEATTILKNSIRQMSKDEDEEDGTAADGAEKPASRRRASRKKT